MSEMQGHPETIWAKEQEFGEGDFWYCYWHEECEKYIRADVAERQLKLVQTALKQAIELGGFEIVNYDGARYIRRPDIDELMKCDEAQELVKMLEGEEDK